MRVVVEYRFVISLALSVVAGVGGLHAWPFPHENPLLGLIEVSRPMVYASFCYAYATTWFSTPFFLFNIVFSLAYIFVARPDRHTRSAPLPPYPASGRRADLFLVLGEQHHHASPLPASQPRWLIIPERGLYTGMLIVGAVGTGKTSACMYPYVEQLLGYRADDPARKIGGLILEVKGDFCRHVSDLLARHGRAQDYVEVSLASPYRYNPLHNELDAYALAYGIATLMTNLFGRGKEPFWQQASTNLVKFVILLHQTLDHYVTLFQVYEHVINPDKLRAKIAEGEVRFAARNRRLVVDTRGHVFLDVMSAWSWHDSEQGIDTWTHWSRDIEDALAAAKIPYRVESGATDAREIEKTAQFEAVKRWFEDDWMRIEPKLRTSIVEGVSVFL